MAKVTLPNISSGFASTTQLNTALDTIEAEFNNKVLYRDPPAGEPNQLEADIDANDHTLYNVRDAVDIDEVVTLGQMQRYIQASGSGLIATHHEQQTAIEDQTLFTFTGLTYVPGINNLAVFVNGLRQRVSVNYTETSSSSITFTSQLNAGDVVDVYTNEVVTSTLPKVTPVASIAALKNVPIAVEVVSVTNYYAGIPGGGGLFYWDGAAAKSTHNGGTIIDPNHPGTPGIVTGAGVLATDWYYGVGLVGNGVWKRQDTDVVNVKDFGAIGDGVANDSPKFQAALNTLKSKVYVPEGTYKVSIDIPTENTTLEGVGNTWGDSNGTILVPIDSGLDTHVIRVDARNSVHKRMVHLKNFSIIGTPGTTNGIGILYLGDDVNDFIDNGSTVNVFIRYMNIAIHANGRMIWHMFSHLNVKDCNYGIRIRQTFNLNTFINCAFNDSQYSGIHFDSSPNLCSFINCNADNSNRSATPNIGAINLTNGCKTCVFDGCYVETSSGYMGYDSVNIENNSMGIRAVGDIFGLSVKNCYVVGWGVGVYVNGTTQLKGGDISNNQILNVGLPIFVRHNRSVYNSIMPMKISGDNGTTASSEWVRIFRDSSNVNSGAWYEQPQNEVWVTSTATTINLLQNSRMKVFNSSPVHISDVLNRNEGCTLHIRNSGNGDVFVNHSLTKTGGLDIIKKDHTRKYYVTGYPEFGKLAREDGDVRDFVTVSALPTTGTWSSNMTLWLSSVAAGASPGWVCTTSGTFGTLVGITGSITAGTAILTVNSTTGLFYGARISIAGLGSYTVYGINGNEITLNTNAGSTVTDAAVSYVTPVFKAMAVVAA